MLSNSAKLDLLVDKAKDWAQINGLCIRTKDKLHSSDYVQIAPFTLLPSYVPKKLYDQAASLQPDMNMLYHKVSFDYQFITSALSNVIKTDDFTRRLLDIYKIVYDPTGHLQSQQAVLTVQRSDYMFHCPMDLTTETSDDISLRQVEVNQISCAGAGPSTKVSGLHRFILRELDYKPKAIAAHLPDNGAVDTISSGLAEAWKVYGHPEGYCLIIGEDGTRNIFDQRLIEYEFMRKTDYNGRVLRMTLTQAATELLVDDQRGCKLTTVDGKKEISVVYFRAGYTPKHYHSEEEWRARLTLERSKAIKCPWIGAHLAGTKKVQQLLSQPAILQRFITCPDTYQRVRSSFVNLYGFDDQEVQLQLGEGGLGALQQERDNFLDRLYTNPDVFVLKPQREGGGNNLYGKDILDVLDKLSGEQREAYILMDRIFPMRHRNYLVRPDMKCELSAVDSELGMWGYMLGTRDGVLKSSAGGHLLRTKMASTNEGGVFGGRSVFDSPYLV